MQAARLGNFKIVGFAGLIAAENAVRHAVPVQIGQVRVAVPVAKAEKRHHRLDDQNECGRNGNTDEDLAGDRQRFKPFNHSEFNRPFIYLTAVRRRRFAQSKSAIRFSAVKRNSAAVYA